MSTVLIVAIIFGSILLFGAMICGTVLAIIRMRSNSISKGDDSQPDEAEMIQEIYQGLSKMEERIDTLETILMDNRNTKG